MKWLLILLGALYALLPMDLIPDLLAGLGWLDDLFLLGLLWYWFFRRPSGSPRPDGPEGRRDSAHADRGYRRAAGQGGSAEAPPMDEDDPHAVLGVAPGAEQAEIRAAYRRLAAQYHPDKVAHLGEEFQRLAEKRFKAIQAAYERLRTR